MKNMLERTKEMGKLEKVTGVSEEIRQQTMPKAIISTWKNVNMLAGNDERLVSVIKTILDWMMILTSSSVCRQEEYIELTEQIVRIVENENERRGLEKKMKCSFEQVEENRKKEKKKTAWLIVTTVIALLGFGIAVIELFV